MAFRVSPVMFVALIRWRSATGGATTTATTRTCTRASCTSTTTTPRTTPSTTTLACVFTPHRLFGDCLCNNGRTCQSDCTDNRQRLLGGLFEELSTRLEFLVLFLLFHDFEDLCFPLLTWRLFGLLLFLYFAKVVLSHCWTCAQYGRMPVLGVVGGTLPNTLIVKFSI